MRLKTQKPDNPILLTTPARHQPTTESIKISESALDPD